MASTTTGDSESSVETLTHGALADQRSPQSDGAGAKPRFFGTVRSVIVIAVAIVVWEAVARTGVFPPIKLPTFTTVVVTLFDRMVSGDLIQAILWSCARVFAGFFIGLVLAMPLGLLIGWSRVLEQLINPLVEVLRPVPPLAWIPLSVIWLGVGVKSVIFITTLGAFFPMIVSVIAGVHSVDKKVIEYSQTLGASTRQVLWKVVVPSALPSTFVGMRIAIGFCWMTVVAAEMISVDHGLGWMIWKARYAFETEAVIGGMVAIGALSVLMVRGVLAIEDVLFRWRKGVVKG
ncbi:MAG: ABC transporter permease [Alphaproteobacteria bacterium]|nr:ABC transporter permease [Alphaproteobacteria bacterium]MCY4498053.1 ABC transporter permease [Rhodospirillaceae bacterium]